MQVTRERVGMYSISGARGSPVKTDVMVGKGFFAIDSREITRGFVTRTSELPAETYSLSPKNITALDKQLAETWSVEGKSTRRHKFVGATVLTEDVSPVAAYLSKLERTAPSARARYGNDFMAGPQVPVAVVEDREEFNMAVLAALAKVSTTKKVVLPVPEPELTGREETRQYTLPVFTDEGVGNTMRMNTIVSPKPTILPIPEAELIEPETTGRYSLSSFAQGIKRMAAKLERAMTILPSGIVKVAAPKRRIAADAPEFFEASNVPKLGDTSRFYGSKRYTQLTASVSWTDSIVSSISDMLQSVVNVVNAIREFSN